MKVYLVEEISALDKGTEHVTLGIFSTIEKAVSFRNKYCDHLKRQGYNTLPYHVDELDKECEEVQEAFYNVDGYPRNIVIDWGDGTKGALQLSYVFMDYEWYKEWH